MRIKVTVKGSQRAIDKLRSLGKLDFSNSLDLIGKYMTDFYGRQVFDTEGSIIGENWSPLNPQYEFAKRTKYPGAGILVASGKLRSSFRYFHTSTKLLFDNPTEYAMVHQKGYPPKNIPQRKFFKVDAERTRRIAEILRKDLERKING